MPVCRTGAYRHKKSPVKDKIRPRPSNLKIEKKTMKRGPKTVEVSLRLFEIYSTGLNRTNDNKTTVGIDQSPSFSYHCIQ